MAKRKAAATGRKTWTRIAARREAAASEAAEIDNGGVDTFARAMKAQNSGFLAGEITPVGSERFAVEGLRDRGIRIKDEISADSHIRASTEEQLAKLVTRDSMIGTGVAISPTERGA